MVRLGRRDGRICRYSSQRSGDRSSTINNRVGMTNRATTNNPGRTSTTRDKKRKIPKHLRAFNECKSNIIKHEM